MYYIFVEPIYGGSYLAELSSKEEVEKYIESIGDNDSVTIIKGEEVGFTKKIVLED